MSVQNLASSWAPMFASSAPNAVLVEHAPTGDVPPGGLTASWNKQCKDAGGSLGETFGVR